LKEARSRGIESDLNVVHQFDFLPAWRRFRQGKRRAGVRVTGDAGGTVPESFSARRFGPLTTILAIGK